MNRDGATLLDSRPAVGIATVEKRSLTIGETVVPTVADETRFRLKRRQLAVAL